MKLNPSIPADRNVITIFSFRQPCRDSFIFEVKIPPSRVPVEAPRTFSMPDYMRKYQLIINNIVHGREEEVKRYGILYSLVLWPGESDIRLSGTNFGVRSPRSLPRITHPDLSPGSDTVYHDLKMTQSLIVTETKWLATGSIFCLVDKAKIVIQFHSEHFEVAVGVSRDKNIQVFAREVLFRQNGHHLTDLHRYCSIKDEETWFPLRIKELQKIDISMSME